MNITVYVHIQWESMITRRKKKEELGVGNFDLNEMKMIKYVTIKKKMTKKK